MVGDTEAAVKWMRAQPSHNGKVGLFGSCSGGRHAFISRTSWLGRMTSIFLHGTRSWVSIGPSERLAVIEKRGELALRPDCVAPPVFDDRILGATRGRCRTRSAPHEAVVAGRIRSTATSSRSNAWLVTGGCDRSCRGLVSASHLLQLGRSAYGMSALEELRCSTEWQRWAQLSRTNRARAPRRTSTSSADRYTSMPSARARASSTSTPR
jgi:hypothetical protein